MSINTTYIKYRMKGNNTNSPNYELVYWYSEGSPDYTGVYSGFPAGVITNIVVDGRPLVQSSNNSYNIPTGQAGGDLSGNYPNPTVSGIDGYSVPTPSGSNTVLTFNAGGLSWEAGGGSGSGVFVKYNSGTSTSVNTLNFTGAAISGSASGGTAIITINGSSPVGNAGGDLSGTYPNPSVDGLLGYLLPSSGNGNLTWTGSGWQYTAYPNLYIQNQGGGSIAASTINFTGTGVSTSIVSGLATVNVNLGSSLPTGPAGGDLSDTYPNPTVNGLEGLPLPILSDGYLRYNATLNQWELDTIPPRFIAGGDLSGSASSQKVIGIDGYSLPTQSVGNLNWTGSAWAFTPSPISLPPNGSASGDLGGSYPNPTVAQITNATGNIKFASTNATPTITQANPTSPSTGNEILIKANNAYYDGINTYSGGWVALQCGSSATGNPGSSLTMGAGAYLPQSSVSQFNIDTLWFANIAGTASIGINANTGHFRPFTNNTGLIGESSYYFNDGYFTNLHITSLNLDGYTLPNPGAASNNTVLTYNAGSLSWAASSGGFTAGGDLSGNSTSSSTHQYVSSLSYSSSAAGGTIAINGTGTTLQFAANNTAPTITQANPTSTGPGNEILIKANNAYYDGINTYSGGWVTLQCGSSATGNPGSSLTMGAGEYLSQSSVSQFNIDTLWFANIAGTSSIGINANTGHFRPFTNNTGLIGESSYYFNDGYFTNLHITSLNLDGYTLPNPGAASNNTVLTYNAGALSWATAPSGFTAGGDLSGTSTSQQVAKITSATSNLNFAAATTSPTISQTIAATSTSTPQNLTISPQAPNAGASNATYGTPGSFVVSLSAPVNGGSNGAFQIFQGGTQTSACYYYGGYNCLSLNSNTGLGNNYTIASSGSGGTIYVGNQENTIYLAPANLYISGSTKYSVIAAGGAGNACSYITPPSDGYIFIGHPSANPAWYQMTGDASLSTSTYGQIKVTGLDGYILPALTSGYLQWNGTSWAFSSPSGTFTAGGDLSGTSSSQQVAKISSASGTLNANNNNITNAKQVCYNGVVSTTASSSTCSIDWTTGSLQKLTLGSNTTLSFTNPPTGACDLMLEVVQGATVYSLAYPTMKWMNGQPYVVSNVSNAIDLIPIHYDGTTYFASFMPQFS